MNIECDEIQIFFGYILWNHNFCYRSRKSGYCKAISWLICWQQDIRFRLSNSFAFMSISSRTYFIKRINVAFIRF